MCVCIHFNPNILFSANRTLVCSGPSIPGQHEILETNKINNAPNNKQIPFKPQWNSNQGHSSGQPSTA